MTASGTAAKSGSFAAASAVTVCPVVSCSLEAKFTDCRLCSVVLKKGAPVGVFLRLCGGDERQAAEQDRKKQQAKLAKHAGNQ
jgi:hypothetical protein